MILILQIALGIVLGWLVVVCIAAAVTWRRERWVRAALAPGAGLTRVANAPNRLSLIDWILGLLCFGLIAWAAIHGSLWQ
jgi:hypothetical protein